MSELSFHAAILTGGMPAESEDGRAAAVKRSLEIFYDIGVEDVLVLESGGKADKLPEYPILSFPEKTGSGHQILAAAGAVQGTHLLVLESGFQHMDPLFMVRLMQMSCLGMGVLPFLGKNPEPLVACYPSSILTLSDAEPETFSNAGTLAMEALERGLVACYQVPDRDAAYFSSL